MNCFTSVQRKYSSITEILAVLFPLILIFQYYMAMELTRVDVCNWGFVLLIYAINTLPRNTKYVYNIYTTSAQRLYFVFTG